MAILLFFNSCFVFIVWNDKSNKLGYACIHYHLSCFSRHYQSLHIHVSLDPFFKISPLSTYLMILFLVFYRREKFSDKSVCHYISGMDLDSFFCLRVFFCFLNFRFSSSSTASTLAMRENHRPLVTIREYPGGNERKNPTKFEFLQNAPPVSNCDKPITCRLQNELSQTLSRAATLAKNDEVNSPTHIFLHILPALRL